MCMYVYVCIYIYIYLYRHHYTELSTIYYIDIQRCIHYSVFYVHAINSLVESDKYISHYIGPFQLLRAQPWQGTAGRNLEVQILLTLRLDWRNRPAR